MSTRKYKFDWELLGDLESGRPNMGLYTRVEVYRLMQFCFRDILEEKFGSEMSDEIFYKAGKLAGQQFYDHLLTGITEFNDLVRELQRLFGDLRIGILRVESASHEEGRFVFTVSEDLDCSGLPENDYEICIYDEGLIAGILERFCGVNFKVKEVDCWCTGDRTCRFLAEAEK